MQNKPLLANASVSRGTSYAPAAIYLLQPLDSVHSADENARFFVAHACVTQKAILGFRTVTPKLLGLAMFVPMALGDGEVHPNSKSACMSDWFRRGRISDHFADFCPDSVWNH